MILPQNNKFTTPPAQIVEFCCSSKGEIIAPAADQEEGSPTACEEAAELLVLSPRPLRSCLKQSTRQQRRRTADTRGSTTWNGNSSFFLHNDDSMSSLASFQTPSTSSSFSSHESSSSSSIALAARLATASLSSKLLQVTFDEQVREKLFVPDWADPRVVAYETKQQQKKYKKNKPTTPMEEHAELRRLDHCYVQVLLKHQRGVNNNTTASSTRRTNPFTDSTVWCPRGLEVHWDPTIGARKRKVRLQSTCHILHTQALQRQRADNEDADETRTDIDQEMADAYRPYSEPCQAEAHRQGLLDELDAHCDVGHEVLHVLQEHRRHRNEEEEESSVLAADGDEEASVTSSSCSSRSSACSIAMVRRRKGRRSQRFSQLMEEPERLSSSQSFPSH